MLLKFYRSSVWFENQVIHEPGVWIPEPILLLRNDRIVWPIRNIIVLKFREQTFSRCFSHLLQIPSIFVFSFFFASPTEERNFGRIVYFGGWPSQSAKARFESGFYVRMLLPFHAEKFSFEISILTAYSRVFQTEYFTDFANELMQKSEKF